MIYEKCPRCELNYKSSDEKYCSVCMRELEGDTFDEEEDAERLCIFCGLRPVLSGDCFFSDFVLKSKRRKIY